MQELLKRTDLMANGRWRHAKFGRGAREAQMSGGRLECAQSIQRYIRSHARAPIDANPPRSTAFPVFTPGWHETRQRTSSNFSQIRAETLGAMGAARCMTAGADRRLSGRAVTSSLAARSSKSATIIIQHLLRHRRG